MGRDDVQVVHHRLGDGVDIRGATGRGVIRRTSVAYTSIPAGARPGAGRPGRALAVTERAAHCRNRCADAVAERPCLGRKSAGEAAPRVLGEPPLCFSVCLNTVRVQEAAPCPTTSCIPPLRFR